MRFVAQTRRLRFLRQREIHVRVLVLNIVLAYKEHDNRAAYSLLEYTRRGSYEREHRTSGFDPLTEGS